MGAGSMLRLVAVFALLAGACSVEGGESEGGGDALESPEETCSRVAEVICQQLFECYSPEERATAMFPATQEDCVAQTKSDLECAIQRVDNQCEAGETYVSTRAQDCVVEYEGLSCDVVREGITDDDTPSCTQVCE
jgi:hypothetical protein